MLKLAARFSVSVALAGPALLAQENQAAPPADAPATRPAANNDDDNPFIISDVPESSIPTVTADQVLRFKLVDGFLLTQTALPAGGPRMQRVQGLPSPVHVAITARGEISNRDGDHYSPDMLSVTYVTNDDSRWTRVSLLTASNHLNLSRDTIANGNEHSVQFVQSLQPGMEGRGASLYVQPLSPEAIDSKQTYFADNFAAFIRKYPSETTKYVRPMVEAIGPQPHLFVVDYNLARSVFPEAFAVDEQRRGEVLEALEKLDADDFRERQQATRRLESMGAAAVAILARLDRSTMPPEQAARVDAIVARIKPPYEVDARELRSDRGFLLDCLLSPDEAVQKAALAQLRKVTGQEIQFRTGLDESSRIEAVYQLRERLLAPPAEPVPAH